MSKIPTAQEFAQENRLCSVAWVAREYAKLCVEIALKAASEKVELTPFASEFLQEGASNAIDKQSILNAYPLENIK